MTTTTTIATIKTVHIDYTEAALIRMVAKVDMPEYGILEGQCFYLARSSKNNGEYYLVTWNYQEMRWQDTCPATVHNCRHIKAVNLDCKKSHVIFSYKPATVQPVTPCKVETVKVDAVRQAEAFIKKVQQERALKAKLETAPSGRLVPMK